jgi:hypothetical protein
MSEALNLFQRAMRDNDSDAMRAGLEMMIGGDSGLSPDDEYDLRHDDYVMEMPQSGERISSRDRMRAMQESFPGPPPAITLRRVTGAGRSWFIEGSNDYGGDVWHVVLVLELAPDGRMLRDTRYYAKPLDRPEWRAAFVDP